MCAPTGKHRNPRPIERGPTESRECVHGKRRNPFLLRVRTICAINILSYECVPGKCRLYWTRPYCVCVQIEAKLCYKYPVLENCPISTTQKSQKIYGCPLSIGPTIAKHIYIYIYIYINIYIFVFNLIK